MQFERLSIKPPDMASLLLAAFVDSSDDAVIGLDLSGIINSWNQAAERIFGFTADEMVGTSILRLTPAHRRAEQESICHKIENGETLERFETQRLTRDGRLLDVSLTARPLKSAGGKILGISEVVRDLSEKRRLEAGKRASESRYRTLFKYAPDGILITDSGNRCIEGNASICQMLGYSLDELIGLHVSDIVAESELPNIGSALHAINTQPDYHHDWKYRRKDGSAFDAQVIATKMPDGNILSTVRDITERKRAEQVLRKATWPKGGLIKELLVIFAFCALIFDVLFYIDPFQASVSRLALKYLDCLDDIMEALLITVIGFVVFTYRRWKKFQEQAGQQVRVQEALQTLHGELETRVQQRTLELAQANDTLHVEIIERKRAETERQKVEEQYRQAQKMESIGQLAGGVAHDFNNILAVIQMQSDLLKTSGSISGSNLGYVNEISLTVQKASALTRQLLLFSRREVFQPQVMDLNESIATVTKILMRTLGENIQMQLKLSSQTVLVQADGSMMDQVLLNLAVNARDAMPEGGKIFIETSRVDLDQTTSTQSPQARPGAYVCLSVSDTGCGIPPEIMPKIFEPFFTTKGVGKGTGLGLATVFGVVQQHDGWVEVSSEVGRGTTFRIYIPRLVKQEGMKFSQSALPDMRGGNETILLVEDDPTLRTSVRTILTQQGYHILEAPTGVGAMNVWNQNGKDIQLLLTDLMMPDGMNGRELAQRVLQDNPKLKVIYISGYSTEIVGKDFSLKEGDNFLAKPFPSAKLVRAVREKLDQRN